MESETERLFDRLVKGKRQATPREQPSMKQLMEWLAEGGCEAIDGCWVEPDGHCPHGCSSWMIVLGLI